VASRAHLPRGSAPARGPLTGGAAAAAVVRGPVGHGVGGGGGFPAVGKRGSPPELRDTQQGGGGNKMVSLGLGWEKCGEMDLASMA